MAVETSAWVMRHSPTQAQDLVVHLCMADLADSTRGDRVEVSIDRLASMARVTPEELRRSLTRLIDAGLAAELVPGRSAEMGVWRLLCDPASDVVFDRHVMFAGEEARSVR